MRRKIPRPEDDKVKVRVRLDSDVLDHFRAMGDDWQDRLNDALARIVRQEKKRIGRRGVPAEKKATGTA